MLPNFSLIIKLQNRTAHATSTTAVGEQWSHDHACMEVVSTFV